MTHRDRAGDLSGQRAMAVAMIYPKPEKGGRGKTRCSPRTRFPANGRKGPHHPARPIV